jgi:hypothetical protein
MKNIVPVILGIAALLFATATGIANANGWFVGRAYLVPRLAVLSAVLFLAALTIAIYNSREQKPKPLIVPLRYGPSPFLSHAQQQNGRWYKGDGTLFSTEEILAGKHTMGHHGLIVANHGEPAYDLSILKSEVQIGTSKLSLEGSKSTFTKADGDAFFTASIERSPGSRTLGSALFDEMRKHQVDSITVALIYKDAENHWYKTVGEIERNVSEIGGLLVKYVRQERTKKPKL